MTADRDKIQDVIAKTEDHFENKLSTISAGALGLTLTFLEKIIPVDNSISATFLIIGWTFLVLTLLLNLVSHMISKYFLRKTIVELDKNETSDDFESIYSKVIKRNRKIDCLNWISVIILILGISFIVLFASVNIMHKVDKKANNESKTTILKTDGNINNSKTIKI